MILKTGYRSFCGCFMSSLEAAFFWLVVYGGLWRFTVVLETVDLLFLFFEDWEFCLTIFGLEATGQTRP